MGQREYYIFHKLVLNISDWQVEQINADNIMPHKSRFSIQLFYGSVFIFIFHWSFVNGACLQVRDEIEHLLDDNEDMAQLYLTRKWIQNQQSEALLGAMVSNNNVPAATLLQRLNSTTSGSLTINHSNDDDVEDLEMLLEAYFMQLDGTRNKILSVSALYRLQFSSIRPKKLKLISIGFGGTLPLFLSS